MVKPRRASVGAFCRATSVPHAVGFKQQLDGNSVRFKDNVIYMACVRDELQHSRNV